jgi:hypothetical protein
MTVYNIRKQFRKEHKVMDIPSSYDNPTYIKYLENRIIELIEDGSGDDSMCGICGQSVRICDGC